MLALLHKRYAWRDTTSYISLSDMSRAAHYEFTEKYSNNADILEEQSCYICGLSDFVVINEIDRYGLYYPTGLCNSCGNIQQTKYYPEPIIIDFYSRFYRPLYDNPIPSQLFDDQRNSKGVDIPNFVASVTTPKNVLEVGCGAGGILAGFKDAGCKVLGLDFDESYLKAARDNGILVKRGSLEQLEPNSKFDLIILSHVLEHIVDPLTFLRQLVMYLEDEGVLYIEVPSLNLVDEGGYGTDLMSYWQNAHTIHFTRETLKLLCKQAGLARVKHTNFIHSCWQKTDLSRFIEADEKVLSLQATRHLLASIERKFRYIRVLRFARKLMADFLDKLGLKEKIKATIR